MHNAVQEAARVARNLAAVSNQAEIWRQLKAFAAAYGFHHLTVIRRSDALPAKVAGAIVYIDAPEGFAQAFDRDGFGPETPLITRALASIEPFSAADTRAAPLSDKQRRVLQHLSVSLNLRDGWTFPISYCGTTRGIVMIGGVAPDMGALPCSILHLLAHTAFKRSEELASPIAAARRTHALTGREVECLHWVAQGKTDLEIATILSISARTARFHVENAKRKLHVATRVQAVAEALRLQAIAA